MTIVAGSDPVAIASAAARLAAGGLVAFPTETVYGLGARADDDTAVRAIYAAKGRPAGHPLIVHVGDPAVAQEFAAVIGTSAQRLIEAFWPGPVTVIVPRRTGRGGAAAGGQDSIGLRMPAHPVALALLRQAARLGVAGVAAPSANRYGRVSPTLPEHVAHEFGDELLVVDGGACGVGIESAIVDCTRKCPALLRPGQVDRALIESVLGQALAAPDADSPRAPGTTVSHYAPAAPVLLLEAGELRAQLATHTVPAGSPEPSPRVGVYSRVVPDPGPAWVHRPMPADAAAAAHELFAVLRGFDAAGVAAIWVERPPSGAAWDGVRDRLARAAA